VGAFADASAQLPLPEGFREGDILDEEAEISTDFPAQTSESRR